MSPEPMEREEAESEVSEAADIIRQVLHKGIAPAWLWKRNRDDLTRIAQDLELAASSLAMDQPYGAEEEADR